MDFTMSTGDLKRYLVKKGEVRHSSLRKNLTYILALCIDRVKYLVQRLSRSSKVSEDREWKRGQSKMYKKMYERYKDINL